uniref:Holliday junction DNA helicase RuvB n=1 Tax=Paulinella chromatophora TaxID=39717 RepID=B1X4N3_PAUCH|nr:Holliday junction DNA helicase RuvB [Paulinella chromatophora]ACB42902.1 Holliday junction DNA helicase RuvB [Paulinella chromatophora]
MVIVSSEVKQQSYDHVKNGLCISNATEVSKLNYINGSTRTLQVNSLRPKSLNDYIGQKELKQILRIAIKAAYTQEGTMDHVLLYGPAGLGKTTIALVLAAELGVPCRIISAPAIERPRDIIGLLMNLEPNEVLFIDEIHRLNRISEELLYAAMEDFRLDISVGKSRVARIRNISINPFTLVGATTHAGALSPALRDRFGLVQRLSLYSLEDLCNIIKRTANILLLTLDEAAVLEIAQRCRGTPRIANRLLRRIRDVTSLRDNDNYINEELANEVLSLHQVDNRGLDANDRRILQFLIENYGGGPVGLQTIAASLGEDATILESFVEPFLMQMGFLKRTPRGRIVTLEGYKHLGWPV